MRTFDKASRAQAAWCCGLILLVGLLGGCGTGAGADAVGSSSGSSGSESGGSESGGSESGGSGSGGSESGGSGSGGSESGGSTQGSGGEGTVATKQCKMVDGKLSYGPIGEPWPLPLSTVSSGDCSTCSSPRSVSGFRTDAGYAFVWTTDFDSDAPGPNLFSMTVSPNFEDDQPPAQLTENTTSAFGVAVAPDGFIVATCSPEAEPKWTKFSSAFAVAASPNLVAPEVPCGIPSWTGQGYLTAFTDTRGLVIALIDEQGAVVNEEIVSAEVDAPVLKTFSRNGDRILFVFNQKSGERAWHVLLNPQGKALGPAQPIGEEDSILSDAIVTASGDGWLVVSDTYVRNQGGGGALFTEISREGLAWREHRAFPLHVWLEGLIPSAYGGALVVSGYDTGGAYSGTGTVKALLQDGEIVYYEETDNPDASSLWSIGIVVDPLRDLVIERHAVEGSEPSYVVQEYGCTE